jgi:hypothetical protein
MSWCKNKRAILDVKERVAECFYPPCLFPEFNRIQSGQVEFLCTNPIHFFPNDFDDLLECTITKGEKCIDSRRQGTDHPGSDHELMTWYLCVGGCFFHRRDESSANTHGSYFGNENREMIAGGKR